MPVQFLMSFGNELIFNEKKLDMNWGQSVYYSFSQVYRPSDFSNENEFVQAMKEKFAAFFDQIYQQSIDKKPVKRGEMLENDKLE